MPTKRILITGGAGFVGCNAARFFGARNWNVTVLDNLSRQGTDKNLAWLRDGTTFDFEHVDVRDRAAIDRVMANGRFDAVIHLAAQVAVTTSVTDPRHRFRRQRARHLQHARRGPPALSGGGLHLRLDQQGLRQDRRREQRAARQPVCLSRSAARHRRNRAARLSVALWLLEGRRGSVHARLRANVQDPGDVVPPVVHLRAAPVRRGGSGLGRLVRHRLAARPRHHDLRRRQAGARRPARRRSPACLRSGHPRAGKDSGGRPSMSAADPARSCP